MVKVRYVWLTEEEEIMKKIILAISKWQLFIFLISALFLINLTDGAQKHNSALEPSYAPLEEGEGTFSATVVDEQTTAELKEVSFFGHTTIGGIRKENDDSNNRLDLATIAEIRVIQPNYESARFRDKEFTLVRVITTKGAALDNLLVPKHVVICGKDSNNIERAWFLSKIDKLILSHGDETREAPEVVVDKIFKGEQAKVFEQQKEKQDLVQPAEEKSITVNPQSSIKDMSIQQKATSLDHSFMGALRRMADAIVDMIKALWTFVRGLF